MGYKYAFSFSVLIPNILPLGTSVNVGISVGITGGKLWQGR